jgi:hypothetical protein
MFNQSPHQSRQSPITVVNAYQLHDFPAALTRLVTSKYRRIQPDTGECSLFNKTHNSNLPSSAANDPEWADLYGCLA